MNNNKIKRRGEITIKKWMKKKKKINILKDKHTCKRKHEKTN